MAALRFPTLSLTALFSTWIGLAACGGKVVVDASGGGGTTTTTTSPGTGGGGGAADCNQLMIELGAAVAVAQTCSPFVDSIQCSGANVIHDACGCEVVANDGNPAAVMAADAAWDAFSVCPPVACTFCPPPPPGPWSCNPGSMRCEPLLGD